MKLQTQLNRLDILPFKHNAGNNRTYEQIASKNQFLNENPDQRMDVHLGVCSSLSMLDRVDKYSKQMLKSTVASADTSSTAEDSQDLGEVLSCWEAW